VHKLARFAIIPAAIVLLSSAAYSQGRGVPGSQEPAPITGTVLYQADNKPAQHVQVVIKTGGGSPIDTYFTGSDGRFTTNGLQPGMYVITIDLEGYKPYRHEEEMLGYPGIRLYITLTALPEEKPLAPGPSVSARELGLPQGAQEALHQGTDALFKKHDPNGSLQYFQKVLVMAPDFYEAAYYEGVAYRELGRKKEAEDALRNSASLSDDKFADADFALASLLTDEGQFPESERLARAGLALQPDAWSGQVEMARVELATGRLAEAEQSALTARKLQPAFSRIYLLLANIHQQQHKNDLVLDDLNTYLKMFPNGPYATQAKAMKEKAEQALGHAPGQPNQLL
jgi:hypothetical protein